MCFEAYSASYSSISCEWEGNEIKIQNEIKNRAVSVTSGITQQFVLHVAQKCTAFQSSGWKIFICFWSFGIHSAANEKWIGIILQSNILCSHCT